ncbi:ZCCHC3 [Branchiostoma lanceolatum]|uniref:ZCCHC3 protein n=1 Tax=Branchiostoma lanceolatum TaxID=7740 RepID=A0A8J9VG21_BRALA|nr:ZCCHC3 [Branchiostoma lanceolatum]
MTAVEIIDIANMQRGDKPAKQSAKDKMLQNILDRYPCRIETKGGTREFNPRTIWITSNRHVREWYKKESWLMGGRYKSIMRRIWVYYWMRLKSHVPNTMRLGNETFSFRYAGQPRLCHRCGREGHLVADCDEDKCSKCMGLRHLAQDCTSGIKCNVCGEEANPSTELVQPPLSQRHSPRSLGFQEAGQL